MIDVALADARRLRIQAAPIAARRPGADATLKRAVRRAGRRGLVERVRRAAGAMSLRFGEDLPLALAGLSGRLASAHARRGRGPAALHRLRIEAKKSRYVLELLGLPTALLIVVQRGLGRWHDLEVLQRELGRHHQASREQGTERARATRVLDRAVETSSRSLLEAARALWASAERRRP